MTKATVKQAMEIVMMQDFGAPVAHIAEYLEESGIDTVTAYHITAATNVKKIVESQNIKPTVCYERKEAVYFFLDYSDVKTNARAIVGDDVEYVTLVIEIPAAEAAKIKYDGLYVASLGSSRSAARLEREIPLSWITGKIA